MIPNLPARRAHADGFTQRLMTGTALGAAFYVLMSLPAQAQSTATTNSGSGVMALPTIAVEGVRDDDYKTDNSASGKFTAPLVDTPKSVTVIPKQVMRERNADSLDDVLRTTPGITLGAGEGGVPNADLPNIRGFASEGNIYIDGMRDTGSQTRDMFNLEQVEVIKGPGSAYAGRGSTGGSLNLVTKKAQADSFIAGSVSAGYPLRGRTELDGNYAFTDNAAMRVNLMWEDTEVAGRDEVETSSIGFAPSLSLGLGQPTRATISLYHLQTDDMPDYGHPYDRATGRPVDVDQENFYGLTNRDFQETQTDAAQVEIEHDIDDTLTVRNVTRFSWSENDYIVTNPDDSAGNVANGTVWRAIKSRNADTTVIANQTELSGDFDTGGFGHSFNTGIELSREESKNRNYSVDTGNRDCSATGIGASSGYNCTSLFDPDPGDPWAGSIAPSTGSSQTSVDTMSIYAFDTIEIDPQWLVNLGLRYDNYRTEAESSGGRGGPYSGSNGTDFINYQAGVVYKPAPNGSVYVNYGTSSDPSGTTAGEGRDNLGSTNENLDPEESRSYEIGTKWDLFDEQLAVTAAIFRTEKTNARIATAPGRGANQVLGGEQRVDGFELGASGDITPRWHVFGGYTFLDSEIVDDGPNATDDGNEIPNVPTHSLSIWSTYDLLDDWTLGGGATYMSSRFGNTGNTVEVPDYWRFDGMASYSVTENVDLRLNVENILDKKYYDKPYVTHFATVAPGRSVVLSTDFTF